MTLEQTPQVLEARTAARDALMNAMTLPSTHPIWDVYVAAITAYAEITDQTPQQAHTELCGGLNA
jgi:hypothetical protein